MDQEQLIKRKKVPDPRQRTLSGSIVHLLWRIIASVLAVCIFFGIAGGVAATRFYQQGKAYIVDDIIPIAHYDLNGVRLNQSSFILAKNPETGEYEEIRQLFALENRIWVKYEEIPTDMINATVAIEDKRFWDHDGVDWMRTLAASANMFIGGSTYGGSTLTQQLIKNLTGDRDVTVRRKLMEIFKALDFEKNYTKEEIITWYMNTIYLGEGAYGIKSAAHVYFGKELNELTTKECACIIGITNNPSRYDPYIYPENNEYRTQTILQQMFEQGYIPDRDTYEAVCDQVLEFKSMSEVDQIFVCAGCGHKDPIGKFKASGDYYSCPQCGFQNQFDVEKEDYYSYFEDTVIRDVSSDLAELKGITYSAANQMVTTGGFRIYSTLDQTAQAKVDAVYQDLENIPKTQSSQQLQSAIIVIDNESGDIIAMAGGVGPKEGNLTWNRATMSTLSPGSSIKPLSVYGPALDLGIISPVSSYEDSAYMKLNGRDWPQNDVQQYGLYSKSGWMIIADGLARSLNSISIKVLADVTPEVSFQFAKERFGLNSLVEAEEIDGTDFTDMDLAPLGMGQLTHGLTVRELATAYATFPNGGIYRKARTYTRVEDAEGNIVLDNTQESHEALSAHAAWYMVEMLRYACNYGTGASAKFNGVPIGGKTGTTSNDRDRWFSGITPKYTASVWSGYDDPEEIEMVVSSNPSALMWKAVMSSLLDGMTEEEIGDFTQPDDERYINVQVCSETGLLAGPKCTARTVGLFVSDMPRETCNSHVEFEIDLCYPNGTGGACYCANENCQKYHNLVTSEVFNTLCKTVPELNRFKENDLQKKTLVMLKVGENDTPTLADALEEYEIEVCTQHSAQRLQELTEAIQSAMASIMDPNGDPDSDPETTQETEP
ncbi:MAG: transglycosylase domain-containing protein [Oscillospiraceae bacterium]|nr:transglycosylase domain-containing protein [Oscillospiraceae bacterium]